MNAACTSILVVVVVVVVYNPKIGKTSHTLASFPLSQSANKRVRLESGIT